MLGSKTPGTKCIRISMCNVLANHDQNLESRFRLLKVCLFVKLESSELQDLLAKSARLDRLKIKLDQSNLMQINFLQISPTQPKPCLTCRVLYFTPTIKGKILTTFWGLLICCVLNLLWDLEVFTFIHTLRVIKIKIHVKNLVIVSVDDRFNCWIKNFKKI